MNESKINLRFATPEDSSEIVCLIRELAIYEKEPVEEVLADPVVLSEQLSSEKPPFECLLAEVEGKVVGFALFFQNYSTWMETPGLYLEDLFVESSQRGKGIGKMLFKKLTEICRDRGYSRMEWQVLNWNTPSIGFYDSLGAQPLKEWVKYRLDGKALKELSN